LRFILTGGEAHDVTTAADLLDGQTAGGIIADKAYDTNALREMIEDAEIEVVIPPNGTEKSKSRTMRKPINSETGSRDSSTSSSIFVGSPLDRAAGRFTS
jgi:transposase